jgi:outer membrane protein TolC
MKTSQLQAVFISFILVFSSSAWGAKNLSWADCVQLVRQNNPDLVSSGQTVKANEAAEGTTLSEFFPDIYGALTYEHSNESDHAYGATLNFSQNLFNGYADWTRWKQSQWATVVSRNDDQLTKAQVSDDLVNAFESLRYALNAEKLSQKILQRREENLRLVELRFESGRENKGSVLLSRANLEQAKFELLQAQNVEAEARGKLAKVLNLDENTVLNLTDDIPLQEPAATPPDFYQLALGTPDVQRALAQERSAQAGITLGKSGFFPTLGVSASTGNTDTIFFPEQNNWSVAATLKIPLWNGNHDLSAYHQAVATAIATENQTVSVKSSVAVKLRQNYLAYVESVAKLKVDSQFQVAAQTRADIGRNKYNNGLLSFEDWDTIENDLINRERALLQSRRDRVLAEAAWAQAQGQGVIP